MSLRDDFFAALPRRQTATVTLEGKTITLSVKVATMAEYDAEIKKITAATPEDTAAVMAGWFFDPANGEKVFRAEDFAALPLAVIRQLMKAYTDVNSGEAAAKNA